MGSMTTTPATTHPDARTARYAGPCTVCRVTIAKGDQIAFVSRGRARVPAHPACAARDAERRAEARRDGGQAAPAPAPTLGHTLTLAPPEPCRAAFDAHVAAGKTTVLMERYLGRCCDRALEYRTPCVCAYRTTCPVHGVRCVGTHD
jgi:hypothetical protein